MPEIAVWIDELREVFGREEVDVAIRAGIDGEPRFWACEGGIEVGTKAAVPDGVEVIGVDEAIRRLRA